MIGVDRFDPFATPPVNGRYLREPAAHSVVAQLNQ
jgi:hypothetical protein